jgi:HEAT repeat protein/beta-lactamase regulating signal transducer with metallopeptidase domain
MSATGVADLLSMHGAAWALGTLLKGTLLLIAVFLLATALRRASAGLRHLVWSGGIAAVLVLPLVTLILPWRLPVVRLPAAEGPAAPARPSAADAPISLATAPSPLDERAGASGPAAQRSQPSGSLERGWTLSPAATVRWVLGIWVLGAGLVLLRLLRGVVLVRRVRRRAEPLTDPGWTQPLVDAADRLGLAREPRLLVSDAVMMPILCGFVDPAIVLPAAASRWSAERRRAVLYHELAHVRRSDLALTVLSRVGCALYWFHPLFWAAARRLRVESERACDDLVLGVGTRPSEYADHLLQIACGAGRARTPAAALPMAERREFEGRMLAILERDVRRAPPSARHAALLAALALLVVVPLAAMGPARSEPAGVETAAASAPGAGVKTGRAETRTSQRTESRNAQIVFTERDASAPDRPDAGSPKALAPNAPDGDRPDREPAVGDSLDPRTLAALLTTLADPVAAVREDAAYALGRLQAGAAASALGDRVLHDAAPAVREMAAWALGQIQSHEATAPLSAAAAHDRAEAVRVMAVWALGQLDDPAAVPGLVAVLADPSAEVRGRAAWAIGSVGSDRAPPALIAALRDPSDDVRLRTAWALGQIGDVRAAPALAAALADTASEVRRAVVWALGRMPSPAAREALVEALSHGDPEVRSRAARALGGGGGDPWPWPWPMPIIR